MENLLCEECRSSGVSRHRSREFGRKDRMVERPWMRDPKARHLTMASMEELRGTYGKAATQFPKEPAYRTQLLAIITLASVLCLLPVAATGAEPLEMDGLQLRRETGLVPSGATTCNQFESKISFGLTKRRHGPQIRARRLDSAFDGTAGCRDHVDALYQVTSTTEDEPETVEARLGLDRATRRQIQSGLGAEGFDAGMADGLFGPRTRAAVRRWQAARGEQVTGYLDGPQADALIRAARDVPGTGRPSVPNDPSANLAPGISADDMCTDKPAGSRCWVALDGQPECYIFSGDHDPGYTAAWTGSCAAGIAHGTGALTWTRTDGEQQIHTGRLENGRKQGGWVEGQASGTVVEGQYVDGVANGPVTVRYADGTIGEGILLDGVLNGGWTARHVNGAVTEGMYLNGKRHGRWVVANIDPDYMARGPYINGEREGAWVVEYENGMVAEGSYSGNRLNGAWEIRYHDGTEETGPFVDDKRHGTWTVLHENRAREEGTYRNGRRHGEWVHAQVRVPREEFIVDNWDPWPRHWTERGSYVDGMRHGKWTIALEHLRAVEAMEGEYVDGEREGRWIYRQGYHTEEGPYVDGKRHGKWTLRRLWPTRDENNAVLAAEGQYIEGTRQGKWVLWSGDGNGVGGGVYRNGRREGEWIEPRGYEGDRVDVGPYVDGEKHGSWISCSDGLVIGEEYWVRGEFEDSVSYGRGDRKEPCPVPVGDSR